MDVAVYVAASRRAGGATRSRASLAGARRSAWAPSPGSRWPAVAAREALELVDQKARHRPGNKRGIAFAKPTRRPRIGVFDPLATPGRFGGPAAEGLPVAFEMPVAPRHLLPKPRMVCDHLFAQPLPPDGRLGNAVAFSLPPQRAGHPARRASAFFMSHAGHKLARASEYASRGHSARLPTLRLPFTQRSSTPGFWRRACAPST
jgi:hypothetical protein